MTNQPCIIGKQITIRGKITGEEDLVVEGRIEGEISLANHLVVESSGVLEANLDVADLTVNGTVHGDVHSSQSVTIATGARVVGTITAPRVVVEDGARFKGRIEMEVKLPDSIELEG
jgi:cytoskeletal protein CcmA (bactofilin family)